MIFCKNEADCFIKKKDALCIYGYWKNNVCVGATWIDKNYPYNLSMALTDKSFAVLKPIAQSYKELFKKFKVLTAKININNFASNKIAIQLGWQLIYSTNGDNIYEIRKENWKYKKKYPVE
jgi:hypothetical protein